MNSGISGWSKLDFCFVSSNDFKKWFCATNFAQNLTHCGPRQNDLFGQIIYRLGPLRHVSQPVIIMLIWTWSKTCQWEDRFRGTFDEDRSRRMGLLEERETFLRTLARAIWSAVCVCLGMRRLATGRKLLVRAPMDPEGKGQFWARNFGCSMNSYSVCFLTKFD